MYLLRVSVMHKLILLSWRIDAVGSQQELG
jgi:hypothetical protein